MVKYLEGEQRSVGLKEDRERLVGKRIKYLRDVDIDKSGRGFFFPRYGTVTGTFGRNLIVDDQDYIPVRDLVEVVEI